jgi:hypothetical protein
LQMQFQLLFMRHGKRLTFSDHHAKPTTLNLKVL